MINEKELHKTEFLNMYLNGQINDHILRNMVLDCNDDEDFHFNNLVFKNITFIDSNISYTCFHKCNFTNCNFINCHFFDTSLEDNKFIDCHFDHTVFYNNAYVTGNQFIRASGCIDGCNVVLFELNCFIDMDFSGFLPMYCMDETKLRWYKNYFINTTLSIDALKNTLSRITHIYSSDTSCDIKYWRKIYEKDSTKVYEVYDNIMNYGIDISDLDIGYKLNAIANCFTAFQTGTTLIVRDMGHLETATVNVKTIPNPRPVKIINSRGYKLKEGVIKSINFIDTYHPVYDYWKYAYDGLTDTYYLDCNNLLDSDNYKCTQLIKK